MLCEKRIQAVEDGEEDDDGDGVEVLHQIVGNAVAAHFTGLGDEVVGELSVDDLDILVRIDLATFGE